MRLPTVPPPSPPARPTNVMHDVASGIGAVVGAPMQVVNLANEGFAKATNVIAQALPCFPAATLGSIAMGMPHGHLHPPSLVPPAPLVPLPPIGPVMFGTSVQVLINGMPAARCGDLGVTPTCCGLPPIYEIFTGSSKVFIGGARAARAMDVTYHCKPIPPAGSAARGTAAAMKTSMKAAMMASAFAQKALMGAQIAGMAAQAAAIAGDTIEAVEADDAAMSAALGMSAAMMAAQMASDAVAMAMGAAMGKDPCIPPGTLGAITLNTSPNVVIGGFPMPSWLAIAKGLLKIVKGLRARRSARSGRAKCGC